MFGDALIKIQEVEKAIDVYEEALVYRPKESKLLNKIANALVTTHQYEVKLK